HRLGARVARAAFDGRRQVARVPAGVVGEGPDRRADAASVDRSALAGARRRLEARGVIAVELVARVGGLAWGHRGRGWSAALIVEDHRSLEARRGFRRAPVTRLALRVRAVDETVAVVVDAVGAVFHAPRLACARIG